MNQQILELCREDGRFAYEAYEFVSDAVKFTQDRLGRGVADDEQREERHVSGMELLNGTCELAIREFGMMAPVVFKQWGVRTTDHIGEIVFKLIKTELLGKSESDDPSDFQNQFDLHETLSASFEISLCDSTTVKRGHR